MEESNQKWYPCPFNGTIHGIKGRSNDWLASHIVNKHVDYDRFYECPYCGYKSYYGQMCNHVASKHEKKIKLLWTRYSCCYCDFKTKNRDKLRNHIKDHLNNNDKLDLNCCYCDFKTKNREVLSKHIKDNHSDKFK